MFKPCGLLLDDPTPLKELPPLYSTEKRSRKEVIFRVRFYHPLSHQEWFACEYDPQDRLFFGLAYGFEKVWGYFNLNEMAFVYVRHVPIFYDMDFKPISFKELEALKSDSS